MKNITIIYAMLITVGVILTGLSTSCLNASSESSSAQAKKELYIPKNIYMVSDSIHPNDFRNDTSAYCFKRSIQSDNLALFWHKEYGNDPKLNPDSTRRFDPERALQECDRFYTYYVNELKMVPKGKSLSDKYKLLIFVFGGDEGTAFGGGEEEKVGILWTPAVRINKEPFGALAHEMGHSFQYISNYDYGTGPTGPIMEMSAQYMLWQVYPEWMTFEKYHLDAFLKKTHYAFLHPQNMYHSPYVLEYWSEIHGKDFYGKLSSETKKGEDPVATYKRMNSLTQEQFNDEMFDASRKFITWDLKRVKSIAAQYANLHHSKFVKVDNGWYKVDSVNCPQNYGYNGIKLEVPVAGTQVVLDFKGIAGDKGYSQYNKDKAGWRYGFLAYLKGGKRIYGDMMKDAEGVATFKVPDHTEYLWLVVSGAPTEHWPIEFSWESSSETQQEEQWPYMIKLSGTSLVIES